MDEEASVELFQPARRQLEPGRLEAALEEHAAARRR
jgi:hypothetical protein